MVNRTFAFSKASGSRIANATAIHILSSGQSWLSGTRGSGRFQRGDATVGIHVGKVIQLEVVGLEFDVNLSMEGRRQVVSRFLVRSIDLDVGVGHLKAAARPAEQ